MLTRKSFKSSTSRSVVLATVAAVVLTATGPSFAGSSASVSKGISATGSSSGVTDFSAARRHHRHHHHRRHYGGGGNAAAAAAFAGIIGTVGAIAASQARRDAYYDYGPGYYAPPPRYYGGPRYPSPYGGAYYAPY
jgi:hypothetical protein